MKTNDSNSSTQNFFSGFLIGAVVAVSTSYLTMTKSGRKLARELLRKAEEIGEDGAEYFEEIANSPKTAKLKQKTGKKINNIIDKLKHEVKAVKKG